MTPTDDALVGGKEPLLKGTCEFDNSLLSNNFKRDKEGKPLMPCRIIKARHLLKNKQAKIVKYEPFTIQLLFECEDKVQDVSLNIDSGSKEIGLCAKTDKKELYSAEAKIRGSEIVELISKRKQLRQSRRSRKTRYHAHKKLISDVYKILPIKKLIVEVASFDIQKIKNPTIQGKEYRQGEQLGWENVKSYIKFRDSYKCQALKTCKNKGLEVHHLESRMTGGNAPNNLTTLCEKHHQEVTDGKRELKIKRGESFKDASFMNIMRLKLVEELKKLYSNVSETYGYITKSVREEHKLEKSHRNDALCINGNLL
ncbi:10377_t:CDS:2 [Funneliformis geosporum]|nr:10377_t:CDS:2 [Funneliformis geosporum]